MKTFQMLLMTEKLGLYIDINTFSKVKAIGQPIPFKFTHNKKFPLAINYLMITFDSVISATNHTGDISGLTQLSSIQMPHNDLDDISCFDDEDLFPNNNDNTNCNVSTYNQLKTSFKSITSIMDGNSDSSDIASIEKFFTETIGITNKKFMNQESTIVHPSNSDFSSSNPPGSKKRKHHGC